MHARTRTHTHTPIHTYTHTPIITTPTANIITPHCRQHPPHRRPPPAPAEGQRVVQALPPARVPGVRNNFSVQAWGERRGVGGGGMELRLSYRTAAKVCACVCACECLCVCVLVFVHACACHMRVTPCVSIVCPHSRRVHMPPCMQGVCTHHASTVQLTPLQGVYALGGPGSDLGISKSTRFRGDAGAENTVMIKVGAAAAVWML